LILQKFIAIKLYLESIGIAFFKIESIDRIFEIFEYKSVINKKELFELMNKLTDNALCVFRLMQHIGIITYYSKNYPIKYTLSKKGFEIAQQYNVSKDIEPLRVSFLNWLPLRVFLKYIEENPNCTTENIVNELGSQIKKHTKEFNRIYPMKNVNKSQGVSTPFNGFVIPNLLALIGYMLGYFRSYQKDGPFLLTNSGSNVVKSFDLLNYRFKEGTFNVDYYKLAIADLLDDEINDMIVFNNRKDQDLFGNILTDTFNFTNFYNQKSEYDGILTKNKFFWLDDNNNFIISYDPNKIAEVRSNGLIEKNENVSDKQLNNNEFVKKISNFFEKAQFSSTYKLILFKSILNWISETKPKPSLILDIDYITIYFIEKYWLMFKNYNLKQLNSKTKEIEIYSIFKDKIAITQQDFEEPDIQELTPLIRKVILKDVIYRFRNDTLLYNLNYIDDNGIIQVITDLPDKIEEDSNREYQKIISHLSFNKTTIDWLIRNKSILEKAINFKLMEFLKKINQKKIMYPDIFTNVL